MTVQSNTVSLRTFTGMLTILVMATDRPVKDVRSACLILSAVWYDIDPEAVDADTRNLIRMDLSTISVASNSAVAREMFECLVRTFVFIGDTAEIKCIRNSNTPLSKY